MPRGAPTERSVCRALRTVPAGATLRVLRTRQVLNVHVRTCTFKVLRARSKRECDSRLPGATHGHLERYAAWPTHASSSERARQVQALRAVPGRDLELAPRRVTAGTRAVAMPNCDQWAGSQGLDATAPVCSGLRVTGGRDLRLRWSQGRDPRYGPIGEGPVCRDANGGRGRQRAAQGPVRRSSRTVRLELPCVAPGLGLDPWRAVLYRARPFLSPSGGVMRPSLVRRATALVGRHTCISGLRCSSA